jgi:ABC-type antimicrobial peptide transport system permease subunit
MTNLSEINVIDKLENSSQRPVSVEDISKKFHGISTIHFLKENSSNNIFVSVYTKNKGSLSIKMLSVIQKSLGATTMSISICPMVSDFEGLIYILTYTL